MNILKGFSALIYCEPQRLSAGFLTYINNLARTIMPLGILSDGLSIWQNRDPVHLTDTDYMEIGMSLLQGDNDDGDFQPPKRRQRLESVVLAVPAKPANVAKAPPPTASWLTDRLDEP